MTPSLMHNIPQQHQNQQAPPPSVAPVFFTNSQKQNQPDERDVKQQQALLNHSPFVTNEKKVPIPKIDQNLKQGGNNSSKEKFTKNHFNNIKKKTQGNSNTSNLTVQVYNLKQNLTKKMLQDLLEPYVTSIDFKTKYNSSINGLDYQDSNNLEINEENVDVFIKFKNLEKLKEAIKSFNLNEFEFNNDGVKKEFRDFIENKAEKQAPKCNKSPFLFKPITIF